MLECQKMTVSVTREKGLWYRQYERHNETIKQLLVPLSRRIQVLRLANESLMGGHMGTLIRQLIEIIAFFDWPGVVSDVKKWCSTFDDFQSRQLFQKEK